MEARKFQHRRLQRKRPRNIWATWSAITHTHTHTQSERERERELWTNETQWHVIRRQVYTVNRGLAHAHRRTQWISDFRSVGHVASKPHVTFDRLFAATVQLLFQTTAWSILVGRPYTNTLPPWTLNSLIGHHCGYSIFCQPINLEFPRDIQLQYKSPKEWSLNRAYRSWNRKATRDVALIYVDVYVYTSKTRVFQREHWFRPISVWCCAAGAFYCFSTRSFEMFCISSHCYYAWARSNWC